jgi:hypothetical protein
MENSKRIHLLSNTEVEELYAWPKFNAHEQRLSRSKIVYKGGLSAIAHNSCEYLPLKGCENQADTRCESAGPFADCDPANGH